MSFFFCPLGLRFLEGISYYLIFFSYCDQSFFFLKVADYQQPLLSDGSVERPTPTGGARLSVILGISTLPYLTHLFKLLESLTDSGISHLEVKDKTTGKSYITVRFKTVMLPLFVHYHELFYYISLPAGYGRV
jgi:hypothetical protein